MPVEPCPPEEAHDWYVCNGRCLNDDCDWRICERCGQSEGAE